VQGCFSEVLEDEHKIELLQRELDTFQRSDLNLIEGTTRNGGSMRCTRHSVVGCSHTLVRNGIPSNDNSRKGDVDFESLTHRH